MVELSNTRPIGILAGYLLACAGLTVFCIRIAWTRGGSSRPVDRRRRHAIVVFSALAALSLATTWYHMFCFFQWSYQEWAAASSASSPLFGLLGGEDGKLHLGAWLRDTTLFQQAWVATLETPLRAWWSMQIFGFCAIWSVMLAAQGQKSRIPHLWLFMLLGQIVAISFAANLSFVTFLVYDEANEVSSIHDKKDMKKNQPSPNPQATRNSWLPTAWLAVLGVNLISALIIPRQLDHSKFLYLLLAPHVLAFVPFVLNAVFAAPHPSDALFFSSRQPSTVARAGIMAVLLAAACSRVFAAGGDLGQIAATLFDRKMGMTAILGLALFYSVLWCL
ncbi:hypothetical protein PFICI_10405 [Pestalotiopsis fici W106-1]|uniref:Uncharacterized protein n=1 Tax=Pestalotiopsis fici (strain W106-1 / CGMCC3.15140) TaxID=1229662 RepID=W3WWT5_PESFW|nr:uncharacterized protein PFICI_10405 [Pestalotiopsis fici W106-1]ETS78343.1 hypothetical protein PFICI_10405 [Pestalotiopsis fici W106-1]